MFYWSPDSRWVNLSPYGWPTKGIRNILKSYSWFCSMNLLKPMLRFILLGKIVPHNWTILWWLIRDIVATQTCYFKKLFRWKCWGLFYQRYSMVCCILFGVPIPNPLNLSVKHNLPIPIFWYTRHQKCHTTVYHGSPKINLLVFSKNWRSRIHTPCLVVPFQWN